RKLNQSSTGNAGGIYNWIITHTDISRKELLKNMDRGILITELMGEGVDIISGNYSRGAVGFWVEEGSIQYPVNEITVSGNLKDMWNSIISISRDVDIRNIIHCGSILLSNMQISGH
ncbi:MAG: metallopeptidase TldD-related protein, partial [Buchnera aphidicola]|nr:metallopeptidase TldD-related protein [Buchnera aphidicola]